MLPVRAGETFRFADLEYDVSGLKTLINTRPERYGPHLTEIDESLLHHLSLYATPDEQRIAALTTAELNIPCIAVQTPDGTARFVDGFHRIQRRWRDGLRTVQIYSVPPVRLRGYVRRIVSDR